MNGGNKIKLVIIMVIICGLAKYSYAGGDYMFTIIDKEFDSIAGRIATNEFRRTSGKDDLTRVHRLLDIALRKKNPQLQARAIYWNIRLNQLAVSPDSCVTALSKARSMTNDPYDLACIDYQLAGNYQRLGQYFNTYQILQKTIEEFDRRGDYYMLGNAHLLMALTFSAISEHSMAKDEVKEAEVNYKKAAYPLNRIRFFEAYHSKNPQEAKQLYLQSVTDGKNDPGMTVQAYINIASQYIEDSKPDSAYKYINLGRTQLPLLNGNNAMMEAILDYHQARVILLEGDFLKGIRMLRDVEPVLQRFPDQGALANFYKTMWEACHSAGDEKMEFRYLKLYNEAVERQLADMRSQEIPKAKAREDINKQKTMVERMKKESELARVRSYIVVMTLVIFILIVVAFAVHLNHRVKMKRIENQGLRQRLEQEMIIKRLNRENFERDMQQKDCQISSSVLLLSNKNDILQQIDGAVREFYDDGKVSAEFVKKINELVGNSLKSDDEWSRFKKHFDSVHPGFFIKLKEIASDLTENDLRLCAYLRIGMRAKEIASMLQVTSASVNTHRYRLRKKFDLNKDTSLDDFVRKI